MTKINEEEFFDQFLDDNYEKIKIFDRYEYPLSRVLKNVDPVLYSQGVADYLDFMKKDGFIIEKDGSFYLIDLK